MLAAGTAGTLPIWGKPPVANNVPPYTPPEAAGDREKGAHVFAQACAGCHGDHGKGAANSKRSLRINDPAFLALISDQALRRIVITGRPDLGMPDHAGKTDRPSSFQPLTSDQITNVVALLASWRNGSTANGR